jgi:ribosomal-protein-alanine N-acetyltransferase
MRRRSHPDVPDHLSTPQLILRPLNRMDAKPYARMFADRRLWTFIPPAYWRAGARSRARSWRRLNRSGDAYHFVIRTRKEDDFVGEIALHHLDWDWPCAELSYRIVRSQWGRGFATESANRLCNWAFQTLRLHRLEATTTEGNHPSEAVLKKLGFRLEGTRVERDRIGKEWVACHEFGLLKPYYRRRKTQLG